MSNWWIPRSVDELETALRDRTVVENHYLEFKQFDRQGKVPATIAGSVAGLAIDGGVRRRAGRCIVERAIGAR